jgi:1,4-alpha-glucan branching enzyme
MRKRLPYAKSTIVRRTILLAMLFVLALPYHVKAQEPAKRYTVKKGKMYIELGRQLGIASLDSFINNFQLQGLALKEFILKGFEDSLKANGWTIMVSDRDRCVISKPLLPADAVMDPVERTHLLVNEQFTRSRFPAVSDAVKIGYNHFRNKHPFMIREDSVVVFYLRNNKQARRVMLAGSFNDWSPEALAMQKTDSGWIAAVKLSPGKYWYKFIIDGDWQIDTDNQLNENDEEGNTNSVFYFTNYTFRLNTAADARKVFLSGSFNNWQENAIRLSKTASGWEIPVYLANGTYTYRFIADGKWMEDPANPDHFPNEFGENNSVVQLGKQRVFVLQGFPGAQKVVLTGSFNNWRTDELFMKKTATGWELPYVLGPGNYEYSFMVDGKWVADSLGQQTSGNRQSKFLLVIEPNYTFRLKGFGDAKQVFLAGNFNNWTPGSLQMKKEGDEWVISAHLSPGKHLYKFIVDDNWIIDPGNKLWEENEHGTGNSVLWLDK